MNIAVVFVWFGVLALAFWAILEAWHIVIERTRPIPPDAVEPRPIRPNAVEPRPIRPDAVEPRPIDHERQANLDAKLAARRAEWELHGRAAAVKRFWDSVALTAAGKKLRRSEAPISDPDELLPKNSFVYLIASDAGPLKIGKADNVKRRLATLQTSSFAKLHLVDYRPVPTTDALSIESRIHKKLAKYRMKGEWFSCDLGTAKAAIDSILPE
jgi:predicted GIY-YIG superfamily endonuclease